jgi:hypothetical protein
MIQWWHIKRRCAAITGRLPVEPAPGPLEEYAARFDDLLLQPPQPDAGDLFWVAFLADRLQLPVVISDALR